MIQLLMSADCSNVNVKLMASCNHTQDLCGVKHSERRVIEYSLRGDPRWVCWKVGLQHGEDKRN